MEKGLQASMSQSLTTSLKPNTVIREQTDKEEVIKNLCFLLTRVAKLYSIPGWDEVNSFVLAEWIMETYPNELMETVTKALYRPQVESKVWRLTPDTISEWMALELEKQAKERERLLHNEKLEETKKLDLSDEQWNILIETAKNADGFKSGPKLTPAQILAEGKETPPERQAPVLPLTEIDEQIHNLANEYGIELWQMKDIRRKWMVECHDLITGKRLPNWMSFEEWLLK